MNYCNVCGVVDDYYDENSRGRHENNPKHVCNLILMNYKDNKHLFTKNKDGILIHCTAENITNEKAPIILEDKCDKQKTRVNIKPNEIVKFSFHIRSDLKDYGVLIIGIQLAHPQPQFAMKNHRYVFGQEPHILQPKSSIEEEVSVTFKAEDIGQYEMPIMFTFLRPKDNKNIIFVREMFALVQDEPSNLKFEETPFTNEEFEKAKEFIQCTDNTPYEKNYKIPKALKRILPLGLNEDSLNKAKLSDDVKNELREILIATRAIFDEGITEDNYRMYFHHLLFWEEIITRINLKKYNMSKVHLEMAEDGTFWLEVQGLAEKRPSLLRGDRVFLRPCMYADKLFEGIIVNIKESHIQIGKLDGRFYEYFEEEALFGVRFLTSRETMERMHAAVDRIFNSKQRNRVLPNPSEKMPKVQPIFKFYNDLVKSNDEQRSAVEHIVSKTCGTTPYIVFGPPGTGKTMTIVEAIIQIVMKNPAHRVLVCTDSNMAADHIAVILLKYNKDLKINRFLLRANSQNREWSSMPSELEPVSNGTTRENFYSLCNDYVSTFRIVVTTLLHSHKYGSDTSQSKCKLKMSHLFIDEAAQALEPAALVPISSLLAPSGQLVLSGDPKQLGPVCISKHAKARGLGVSLLERLWNTYKDIYEDNSNFITTLVQNYRSDPDILAIPNQLFYKEKPLQARAKPDSLSRTSILGAGGAGGARAVVFHSVNSTEQRLGTAPSFFNERELYMLQRYVVALINDHNVEQKDIGIISPYIRQVYKVREWLKQQQYAAVEVGTVESFQGREKRAVLVSTVRANYRLLDHDARYQLGFLVEDKRFNVTLTRAKAKLVIIGNPACLVRDEKWRKYMDFCSDNNCYFGKNSEQLERSAALLAEVARRRFDTCRLTEAIAAAIKEKEQRDKKNNKQKK